LNTQDGSIEADITELLEHHEITRLELLETLVGNGLSKEELLGFMGGAVVDAVKIKVRTGAAAGVGDGLDSTKGNSGNRARLRLAWKNSAATLLKIACALAGADPACIELLEHADVEDTGSVGSGGDSPDEESQSTSQPLGVNVLSPGGEKPRTASLADEPDAGVGDGSDSDAAAGGGSADGNRAAVAEVVGSWDYTQSVCSMKEELDEDLYAFLELLVTKCGLLPYFVCIFLTSCAGDIMRFIMRIICEGLAFKAHRMLLSFIVKKKGGVSRRMCPQ
jgi:hypothetical protein